MFKKLLSCIFLAVLPTVVYADTKEHYSYTTVYKCSLVAGARVLRPENAAETSFQERIEVEPTCKVKDTFFNKESYPSSDSVRSHKSINNGEEIWIFIQRIFFSLSKDDTHA
jgi:hypothetical protein